MTSTTEEVTTTHTVEECCDTHDFDYTGSETIEGGRFINFVECSKCGYNFSTKPTRVDLFLDSLSRIEDDVTDDIFRQRNWIRGLEEEAGD
jgi:hypothetical protein